MKPTGDVSNYTGQGKDWPINPGKSARTYSLEELAHTSLDRMSRQGQDLVNSILSGNELNSQRLNVMPVHDPDPRQHNALRSYALGGLTNEAAILAGRRLQLAQRLDHLGLTEAAVSDNPDYLWEQHIMSYDERNWWHTLENIPNRLRRSSRDHFSREINRALPQDDATLLQRRRMQLNDRIHELGLTVEEANWITDGDRIRGHWPIISFDNLSWRQFLNEIPLWIRHHYSPASR